MERSEMLPITNGMPAILLRQATWRKSSHSNPSGDCVELAELVCGQIAVRNSRHPSGPALIFTRVEMAAFIREWRGECDEVPGDASERNAAEYRVGWLPSVHHW